MDAEVPTGGSKGDDGQKNEPTDDPGHRGAAGAALVQLRSRRGSETAAQSESEAEKLRGSREEWCPSEGTPDRTAPAALLSGL